MPLKWWMVGESVDTVTRQSQNIDWVLLVLKSRMVGECVEWVTRDSQYIGQVIMV